MLFKISMVIYIWGGVAVRDRKPVTLHINFGRLGCPTGRRKNQHDYERQTYITDSLGHDIQSPSSLNLTPPPCPPLEGVGKGGLRHRKKLNILVAVVGHIDQAGVVDQNIKRQPQLAAETDMRAVDTYIVTSSRV